MRVLVFGAGGVGGYFGGRLAAAGCDVAFIARGDQLSTLRDHGLHIKSKLGDSHVAPVKVADDPQAFGQPEIILFCVKLYDVEDAGARLAPALGKNSLVIPLQNGICAQDRLVPLLGKRRVAGGVAHISSTLREPGVVAHDGTLARFFFGSRSQSQEASLQAFSDLCLKAGVEGLPTQNIDSLSWQKFIFLSAFSGVTALTRLPLGSIRKNEGCWSLFVGAMGETYSLARAKGIDFDHDPVDEWQSRIPHMPASYRASMAVDLENEKPLELPYLSGTVVRLGRDLGVPTPIHDVIWRALSPYVEGKQLH